jgi:hypothetical protein
MRSVTKIRPILACLLVTQMAGAPLVAVADQAGPKSRAECFSLHEKAQLLRNDSKLLQTRQVLRQCSQPACPALITSDCVRWLEEVERQIPTVVFEAVDGDKDVVAVKVTEGDRVLADAMTGSAVEFDPGAHKFKAESADRPTQETTFVLREGEKARVIRINFTVAPPPHLGGLDSEPKGPRPMPKSAIVFGSLGVVAAGAGAALGVLALKKKSDLDAKKCKPICSDEDVKPVKSFALYADIAFGAAVLSAGIATILYLNRPVVPLKDEKSSPPGPNLKPEAFISPNSAGIGLGGSF